MKLDKYLNWLFAVIIILLFGTLVFAAWNATKQQIFVERLDNLAHQLQDSREECTRLVDIWFGESVSSSPDFIDHSSGITTTEMIGMITYCQDLASFNENVAVAAIDRKQILIPFLATRVRP